MNNIKESMSEVHSQLEDLQEEIKKKMGEEKLLNKLKVNYCVFLKQKGTTQCRTHVK